MGRLYLARRKGSDLIYAGKVDHGFDNASRSMNEPIVTPPSKITDCR